MIRDLRRARRILIAEGWLVLSAAGHLGPFNLVALSPGGLRLICVRSAACSRLSIEEEEILHTELPPASKELWIFRNSSPHPTIKLIL
jgi:hypothetical protein